MYEENDKSLRASWKFDIGVGMLLKAIDKKITLHSERLEHWQRKQEESLTLLREEGIVVDNSIDLNRSTSYNNETVSINPRHRQALTDAQAKVKAHEDKLEDFKRYERAFKYLEAGASLGCTIKDIEFFGL